MLLIFQPPGATVVSRSDTLLTYQKPQLDSLLPAMYRGYNWDMLFS